MGFLGNGHCLPPHTPFSASACVGHPLLVRPPLCLLKLLQEVFGSSGRRHLGNLTQYSDIPGIPEEEMLLR